MPRKIQRFLLAVLPVLFFSSQVLATPETSIQQRSEKLQPSAKKPSVLTDVFKSQFKPEELKALGSSPSLEKLSRSMSPEQKSAAKSQLKSLETKTSDPKVLAEISQGYMLLGKHQDMARVGATIQKLNPKSSKGFTITAQASLELGDYEDAVSQAKEALRRNPDDKAAFGALKLSEGRVSKSKSGSTPPAKKISTASPEEIDSTPARLIPVVTKSVLANMPVPPELSGPDDTQQNGGKSSALRISAKTALATAGALLLFGGLGNKKLEERYPNIKRNMLIGAGIGGLIGVGGMLALKTITSATTATAASLESAVVPTIVTVPRLVNNPTTRRFGDSIIKSFAKLRSQVGSLFPRARQTKTPMKFSGQTSQRLKSTLVPRQAPQAENPRLQKVIKELFRPKDRIPGGTAGAIRSELRTGQLVGGKPHIIKGEQRIRQLRRILREEQLPPQDRSTAVRLIDDLQAALQGN